MFARDGGFPRGPSFRRACQKDVKNKVVLVDRLSRDSTVTGEDLNRIKDLPWLSPGGALKDWISQPCLDWNLPVKIVKDVQDMLENKL